MARSSRTVQSPRISANELARYMVSTDPVRLTILTRSKFPRDYITTRYNDVRRPLVQFLTDAARDPAPLAVAKAKMARRAASSADRPNRRNDALKSIEVLEAATRMADALAPYTFQPAPVRQAKLSLSGVAISVRADLLVFDKRRSADRVGAAILRMSMAERSEPQVMGEYVATLLRMHVEANLQLNRIPTPRLCMSIDVRTGDVIAAPRSDRTRIRRMESACAFISSIWPSLDSPD